MRFIAVVLFARRRVSFASFPPPRWFPFDVRLPFAWTFRPWSHLFVISSSIHPSRVSDECAGRSSHPCVGGEHGVVPPPSTWLCSKGGIETRGRWVWMDGVWEEKGWSFVPSWTGPTKGTGGNRRSQGSGHTEDCPHPSSSLDRVGCQSDENVPGGNTTFFPFFSPPHPRDIHVHRIRPSVLPTQKEETCGRGRTDPPPRPNHSPRTRERTNARDPNQRTNTCTDGIETQNQPRAGADHADEKNQTISTITKKNATQKTDPTVNTPCRNSPNSERMNESQPKHRRTKQKGGEPRQTRKNTPCLR